MENRYMRADLVAEKIAAGKHREFIGGMWEALGDLQFAYMKSVGLLAHHKLLDVGCGSLRGGVHFIPYLEPKHYFGFDINQNLMEAGLTNELSDELRQSHIRAENFSSSDDFTYPAQWQALDFAIGLSLFTHLSLNTIKLCLWQTRKVLKTGGKFHATIFLVEKKNMFVAHQQSAEVLSHPTKDPFHYTHEDMEYLAAATGFSLCSIDDFEHPRNQKMAVFQKI